MFISPKWKNTILEMSLKSSIMSKLDHQKWRIWYLSSGQEFDKNFLDSKSKHVLKVYFKPSRKNQKNLFLPLPSVPVWLPTRYLSRNDCLNFSFVKDKHIVGKKWPDIVVKWPFISCYFSKVSQTCLRPQATSEGPLNQLKFRLVKHLKMTVWTSVLWKILM